MNITRDSYLIETPMSLRVMPATPVIAIEAALRREMEGAPEWRQLSILKSAITHYRDVIKQTNSDLNRRAHYGYIRMALRLYRENCLEETGVI